MQKVDLDAMSIEDLAALRDNATIKLAEKVAARQKELEDELERLSVYGKPRKAAPAPKASKEQGKDRGEEPREPAAKAA